MHCSSPENFIFHLSINLVNNIQSFYHKIRKEYKKIGTGLCPCRLLPYMNFCSILECYADIFLAVYGHEVHNRSPQTFIKLRY
jgi:hypothetical protein